MASSFTNKESLKGKKLIETLFEGGSSVTSFPLRLVYISSIFNEDVKIKAGFSVGKRNFKTAVMRNRIKRLLRESYRLNKDQYFNNITTQYALMILYIGNKEPKLIEVDKAMKSLLNSFRAAVSNK